MDQLVNVLLDIAKAYTMSQRVLNCRPGLSGLKQVYGPNHPTPSTQSICQKYNNIFIRCTNRNQFDIIMTAVANDRIGQTDMPYKGEYWTLTKQ